MRVLFTAFGVTILALLSAGAAIAAQSDPLQQKINACHAISDRDTRIACYDRLAEPASAALPMSAAPVAAAPPAPSSLAVNKPPQSAPAIASASPPAPAPSGAPPSPAPSVALQSPAPQPLSSAETSESLRSQTDEIVIAIASSTVVGTKLSFTTSDGIIWDQTDDKRLRQIPAPGDLVTISRGYLGYMCKLSKHEKFRCKPPYGLNGKMRPL